MNKRPGVITILVAAVGAAAGLFVAVAVPAAVPAASAKSAAPVKLSLLPLPKSSLGSATRRLPLERSGGVGVTEVRTSVDQYKTSADATDALSAWKGYDRRVSRYDRGGLAVAIKAEKVAPVCSRLVAFLVRYRAANIAPLFGFDEEFTQDRYEADVTVWAGRKATAEKLAPKLAGKLEARITLALSGRLHAKPVKLRAAQEAGPPSGGPDLAPLALTPTDLGVQATSWERGYATFSYGYGSGYGGFGLSYYFDTMAGQFGECDQNIHWFATANQASFAADLTFSAALFGRYGPDYPPPVDLSSVGDGAEGVLWHNSSGGGYAELVFSSGQLAEFVNFQSSSAISPSHVQNVAQTVANKINAAGLGS